jgi:FtsP/CotA-like multicopper oxidase with cupredoxin domain
LFIECISRAVLDLIALAAVTLLTPVQLSAQHDSAPANPPIQANSNLEPAGRVEKGVLTLHLRLQQGDWFSEAETGPSMKVYAFGEEGKALQVPAPLIRVPEGTEIDVTLHNLLPVAAVVHGLHQHPGEAKAVVEVPSQETRELRFTAGAAGTYQYYASAGGELGDAGRPFREDSQLAGAFIVDPPGKAIPDRIFVPGLWRSGSEIAALRHDVPTLPHMITVINGRSWPYTERLNYTAGHTVRWRVINTSDGGHPMHMHGSYFRVTSAGDGEIDHEFAPEQQRTVSTYKFGTGGTMTMDWTPPPGHWIFHCHFVPHISPALTVANALGHGSDMEHGGSHMAGMVLGITVSGKRPVVPSHGRVRKIRLLVRERAASNGLPAGFGYQIEEGHQLLSEKAAAPGPLIVLERGRPVEINIINELHQPTTVHWHSMELESYYDGVAGWGVRGREVTPMIQPGGSFRARFTPPRAGTFMYHTHMNDEVQLPAGLYGPLIVLEPGEKFDPAHDHIAIFSRPGPGPVDGPLLLNGSVNPPTWHWTVGQRYRLRLINIAAFDGGTFSLRAADKQVQWQALAKDGADLPPAQAEMQEARQLILPGEIYDFEYRPSIAGNLQLEFSVPLLKAKVVQQIQVE